MKKYYCFFPILFSGALVGLAIYNVWFWLTWIALIPFFYSLKETTAKQAFLYGFTFGSAQGLILLFWIINATQKYSGSNTLLGIPLLLIAVIYFALYPAIFALSYSYLIKRISNIILLTLATGFLWVVIEWANVNILTGIPWIKYSLGFSQTTSLYGMQLNSVTGQWGISFVIVVANFLFAHAITCKSAKPAVFSLGIIILFFFAGYILLSFDSGEETKTIKVAILQENIKAETRWHESNGDSLANVFFDLNKKASALNPELIVWSETALPWTFSVKDDLIRMALEITRKTNAGHIIGILSKAQYQQGKVYNSVYYFEPDGRATARYDKTELLSFIEKPLLNPSLKVPFLSEGVYNNTLEGNIIKVINTPKVSIGMLVCNESLLPYLSRKAVNKGAELLVNVSNDAWFEGTQLIDHHFFCSRMRAVETGKSIIINSNKGIAGFIDAKGRIVKENISDKAECVGGSISANNTKTLYTRFGDWFVFVGIFFLLGNLMKKEKERNRGIKT